MILDWQAQAYHYPGTLAIPWVALFSGGGFNPIFDRYGTVKSASVGASVTGERTAGGVSGPSTPGGVSGAGTARTVNSPDTGGEVQ